MTKTDKRFHITVSNDNTVRLIDRKKSNDLISIGFKEHSNASDCSDALQYLCNLMNGLAEENEQLKQQKDKWKQQCIHFKGMLDDMDIAYLCDEWIYGELKGDLE